MDTWAEELTGMTQYAAQENRERYEYSVAHGYPEAVELVPWDSRCPECDEQRMDWLVWDNNFEDDVVTCWTCGHRYTP